MKTKTYISPQGTRWNTDPVAIRTLLDELDAKAHDAYGWTTGGECLWCGESSRCTCSHGNRYSAALLRHAPDLISSLIDMIDMFNRHISGQPGPDNAADRWDHARAALQAAVGAA